MKHTTLQGYFHFVTWKALLNKNLVKAIKNLLKFPPKIETTTGVLSSPAVGSIITVIIAFNVKKVATRKAFYRETTFTYWDQKNTLPAHVKLFYKGGSIEIDIFLSK